jgi:hypothetical protein
MATSRGNERKAPRAEAPRPAEAVASEARLPGLPDVVRRVLSLGLSGFFLTEEAVRKALGDSLPKDWVDFAVDQSERTRKEFLERLTYEMARTLEGVDLAQLLRDLLDGRTLEIKAQVRLASPRSRSGRSRPPLATSGRDPEP